LARAPSVTRRTLVYAEWRQARVNIDYHVEVDHHLYSVPYRLTHQTLDVRLSATTVEVFQRGTRVWVHRRGSKKSEERPSRARFFSPCRLTSPTGCCASSVWAQPSPLPASTADPTRVRRRTKTAYARKDVPYTKAALCLVMNSSMFIAWVPVSSPIRRSSPRRYRSGGPSRPPCSGL
jgi:Mu transposase, C-terminal domain